MPELTDREIAQYHEQGWIVPDYRVPADLLADARARATAMMDARADYRDLYPDMLGADIRFVDMAREPGLLDILEQLIGPDIALWTAGMFGKPAGNGKATPWHQDGEYWPIEPLDNVSVWIALDDCTPENGCLRFIPGSHKARRLYRHHNDASEALLIHEVIDADEYDERQARDVPLRAGEMAIFDVFTVHGSHANPSAKRRAGFVLRIMPTTSHFNHNRADVAEKTAIIDWANRPLYLLRGRDVCGRNDFRVGH